LVNTSTLICRVALFDNSIWRPNIATKVGENRKIIKWIENKNFITNERKIYSYQNCTSLCIFLRGMLKFLKNQNGGSNMADEISESHWIHSKFVTGGLFRSQITNLQPHYKNLKWRLQYGGRNFQNSLDSLEIRNAGIISVHNDEFITRLQTFKLAVPIWRTKFSKFIGITWNLYLYCTVYAILDM